MKNLVLSVKMLPRFFNIQTLNVLLMLMLMMKIKRGGTKSVPPHVDEDKTTTLIQGTGSNYKSKTVAIREQDEVIVMFLLSVRWLKNYQNIH
jgi:hypothetical protein